MHLGHTVCTKDCEDITLTAKINFWKHFNMLILGSYTHLLKYNCLVSSAATFMDHHCAAVPSLCVGWRKSLMSLWCVHHRTQDTWHKTHCDVITALSDRIPLMATLQKRSISFISIYLSGSNHFVSLIPHLPTTNPASYSAGKNYRSVIDTDGELNNSHSK